MADPRLPQPNDDLLGPLYRRLHQTQDWRSFLNPSAPAIVARAPGRLDVMGGIGDYSGSRVLELPLQPATYVVLQSQSAAVLDVMTLRAPSPSRFSIEIEALVRGPLAAPEGLRRHFESRPRERWAAYVAGVIWHLLRDAAPGNRGFRLLVVSDVPEGKGLSSSAALEVATMTVAAKHLGVHLEPHELAQACQWVENHVVGAPCGIMDQMTCTMGRRDQLLMMRCQPAHIEGYARIPDGYAFFGIDSGVRHAVTGAEYGTVRGAAFMGYRLIADAAGMQVLEKDGHVQVEDPRWHGYLANVKPVEYESEFRDRLPEQMVGRDFLQSYGGVHDAVTTVEPETVYPVRAATEHPIYENERVRRFADALDRLGTDAGAVAELGALMHQAHASYSACGLGSEGTDHLVALARAAGPDRGILGAKITGGGSGGTVAIFGTREAAETVQSIAAQYEKEAGRRAAFFAGSSPGAAEVGVRQVDWHEFQK